MKYLRSKAMWNRVIPAFIVAFSLYFVTSDLYFSSKNYVTVEKTYKDFTKKPLDK